MSAELLWRKIQRKEGRVGQVLRAFLAPFSWLYAFIFRLSWLLSSLFSKPKSVKVPVLSVGNLVVGGSGKTPVVLYLAQLMATHHPVSIVLRGYKSKAANAKLPIKVGKGSHPEEVGDEALMLFNALKETHPYNSSVFVGGNRYESALAAQEQGAKLIILDDGYQQRRLVKDWDLVLLSVNDLENPHLLPWGRFREPLKALSRASAVILMDVDSKQAFEKAKRKILGYFSGPILGMHFEVMESSLALRGKKVGAFCGIARPWRFKKFLEQQGAEVIKFWEFDDHQAPTAAQLKQMSEELSDMGASALVCTEKDHVKLGKALELSVPLGTLKICPQVVCGLESWNEFWSEISKKVERV